MAVSTGESDIFYRVLDESRFNGVLIPNRIRFEKVRFQGVKRGSEPKKNENFRYASGSLPKILVFTEYTTECIVYCTRTGRMWVGRGLGRWCGSQAGG